MNMGSNYIELDRHIRNEARIARAFFETGEDTVYCIPGTPQWVYDIVLDVHEDFTPDAYKYDMIVQCLDTIIKHGGPLYLCEAPEPCSYASSLTDWLNSSTMRLGYCDEASREAGTVSISTYHALQRGQLQENKEIMQIVYDALENRAVSILEQDIVLDGGIEA